MRGRPQGSRVNRSAEARNPGWPKDMGKGWVLTGCYSNFRERFFNLTGVSETQKRIEVSPRPGLASALQCEFSFPWVPGLADQVAVAMRGTITSALGGSGFPFDQTAAPP